MRCFPQVLRNVPVRTKEGREANPRICAAIAKVEELLAAKGRIFVRPCGTEQLIRVMAEGPEAELLERIVADVAGAIQEELGN